MTSGIIDKGIFRLEEYLVDSEKVIFVFTAMGTKISLYRLFAKSVNKKGYSCVVYDYPLDMLYDPNLHEWKRFYEEIIADAQNRLDDLRKTGYRQFFAYGISMGTLVANKFARDTPEISHLVLNLTYGDVAKNIWTYKGIKMAKDGFEKQGIDESALREGIHYADPIVNAGKLKGKKVLLYLSKKDKILVYDQTQYTKDAFVAADLDLQYVENKYLGHYLGGAKNLMAIGQLDKFLSDK